eukprot:6143753-Lingulodinium_polyedra.AAC.1
MSISCVLQNWYEAVITKHARAWMEMQWETNVIGYRRGRQCLEISEAIRLAFVKACECAPASLPEEGGALGVPDLVPEIVDALLPWRQCGWL